MTALVKSPCREISPTTPGSVAVSLQLSIQSAEKGICSIPVAETARSSPESGLSVAATFLGHLRSLRFMPMICTHSWKTCLSCPNCHVQPCNDRHRQENGFTSVARKRGGHSHSWKHQLRRPPLPSQAGTSCDASKHPSLNHLQKSTQIHLMVSCQFSQQHIQ